jgi:arylsulfatase A-like enzyme
MMTRREFFAAAAGAAAAQPARPNILFILLDDLGHADVGCYGQRKILTPNIDRLAAEGMRFTQCYAGGSVCAPSRASLMTGLHTGHAPIRANAGTAPLADDDVTVAEVLKRAGYVTGGYGKWGLGDAGSTGVPHRQGFDEFFGYLHQIHAHSYYPKFLWRNGERVPLEQGQYSADVIYERARAFLAAQSARQPFFLYAAFTLPHGRHEIPTVTPYQDRDWPEAEKIYAAMVTKADTQIGGLLSLLREKGLDGNTIVFFTSDNGGTGGEGGGDGHNVNFFRSNGGLRGRKGQLYEGGIRAPMVVRWHGRVRARSTSALPWAFCDVMPTLAELAGAAAPPGDGVSVVPTLLSQTQAADRFLYWEQHQFDRARNDLRSGSMEQAVRWGGWKAVRRRDTAIELYDLDTDPAESTDVAAANPRVIARIEEYLKTARTEPRPHNQGSFEFAT